MIFGRWAFHPFLSRFFTYSIYVSILQMLFGEWVCIEKLEFFAAILINGRILHIYRTTTATLRRKQLKWTFFHFIVQLCVGKLVFTSGKMAGLMAAWVSSMDSILATHTLEFPNKRLLWFRIPTLYRKFYKKKLWQSVWILKQSKCISNISGSSSSNAITKRPLWIKTKTMVIQS